MQSIAMCYHSIVRLRLDFRVGLEVGFGVGHISNTIEHTFIATVPEYLNSKPPQYIPEAT